MLEGLESASRPHPALSCRHGGNEGASRVCFMSSSVCSLPFSPSHLQILVTSLQNKRPRVTFQQNILAAWLKTTKKQKKEVAKYFFIWCLDSQLDWMLFYVGYLTVLWTLMSVQCGFRDQVRKPGRWMHTTVFTGTSPAFHGLFWFHVIFMRCINNVFVCCGG